MDRRLENANSFLQSAGWGKACLKIIAGDASNRRYARLTRSDGAQSILMDAPPEKGEDVRPFSRIARYLSDNGFSAPKILATDEAAGYLLLEDLGDDLYSRVLDTDVSLERALYQAATDVLANLHRCKALDLERYDAPTMTTLACLAFDWYQLGATGGVDTQARSHFAMELAALLAQLDTESPVVVQRDFHAENLLWLPARDGQKRVGLLDFQDAMLGHPAYDLVSVLQDARRDVSPEIEREMITRYIDARELDPDTFTAAYEILGVQRNLRILGVFARLSLAYGKPHYVDFIPRVWGHLCNDLSSAACATLRDLVLAHLPAPTEAILKSLKDQCGTQPIPS